MTTQLIAATLTDHGPIGFDPALPTLSELLAGPGHRRVVGYRPGSRCTVRVEHEGEIRYARVVASGGEQLHLEAVRVWLAWEEGRLGFFVPRPLGYNRGLKAVWQGELAGDPVLPELYGDGGIPLALRIGYAAGSVVDSGLHPHLHSDAADHFTEATRRCLELRGIMPGLASMIHELLGKLWIVHVTTAERAAWPIQGDLRPARWLKSEVGLGLAHCERFALGDPEFDAATFIAGVDADGGPPEVCEAFLAGYEDAAGTLDQRLVEAYRAQVRVGELVEAARAMRPDGDRWAELHLRHILTDLGRALP